MATHTLKLRDAELALPGLALPEAFESLEKHLDSTIKLSKLRTPPDGQILSLITICQEMQRLLKCAFIENGFLASRLEIFTRYHSESLKKLNKTVSSFDFDHKVTKKQIKRLRKRISVHDTYQKKKDAKWWDVEVRSTDYESFSILSRSSGSPDLEFMLRINQILIDFVRDQDKTELLLPPMGHEERAELAKLASIYKIRCRYGKSTQLATSTLMKARQTCIPGHGEVDAILDGFARSQNLKRLTVGGEERVVLEEAKQEVVVTATEEIPPPGKGQSKSPPLSSIPPTMLTPLSSLTSPTIDISQITSTPSHSPPASGITTPTAEQMRGRRESADKERARNRSRCGSQSSSENPLPRAVNPAPPLGVVNKGQQLPPGSGVGGHPQGGGGQRSCPPGALTSTHPVAARADATAHPVGPLTPLQLATTGQQATPATAKALPVPPGGGGGAAKPLGVVGASPQQQQQQQSHPVQQPPNPLVGGLLLQHHASLRQMGHSTVLASPLKVPVSQLPHVVKHSLAMASTAGGGGGGVARGVEPGSGGGGEGVRTEDGGKSEGGGEGGGGGKRVSPVPPATGAQPPKRIRLTRKSAGLATSED